MQAQKKYVFVAISIQVLVSLTTFAGEWSLSKKPDVSLVEESDVETLDQQIIQLEKAGKYSEAVPLATKLLKSCEELMGADHPATAIVLGKLARLHDAAGDYGKAEALFQRALKICESALGPRITTRLRPSTIWQGFTITWAITLKPSPFSSAHCKLSRKTKALTA